MRRPASHVYYPALWCIACVVLPFLRGRELAHPELFPWWAAGALGALGIMGSTGVLFRGKKVAVPKGWGLCLFLACLSALCPLFLRTTALDPALLWCAGLFLGFTAFRAAGQVLSFPWLGMGCVLAAWSVFRRLELPFVTSSIPHGNPNLLGVAVAAAFPQALSYSKGKPLRRIFLGLFLLGGVVCSGSLGAFLALVLGVFYRSARGKRILLSALLLGWLFVLLFLGGMRGLHALKPVYDTTIGIRLYIWEGSAAAFRHNPWTGWGPTRFQWIYPAYRVPSYFSNPRAATGTRHAHGELLERAVEEGFLGLVPFLLFLGGLFMRSRSHPGRSDFQASAFILLLHGWMDITLRAPGTTFLFAMAAGAASRQTPFSSRRWASLGFLCMAFFVVEGGRQRLLFKGSNRLWRAREAVREKNWDRAVQEVETGVSILPQDVDLLLEQGFVWAQMGRYKEAEDSYRNALTLSPHFADARASLAKMLLLQGKESKAQSHLRQASKDNPWDVDTLWNLALVCLRLGEKREAYEACRKLLMRDPHHEQGLSLMKELTPGSDQKKAPREKRSLGALKESTKPSF